MPYQICVLWFLVEFDLSYLLLILCYAILFQESLNYRLNGSESDIGSWGHEYVRNLAGEIAKEYTIRQGEESSIEDLMDLVQQIVSFHMKHNAETEAVDLLMDVEDLDLLLEHVDNTNFRRTCNYLTSAAK